MCVCACAHVRAAFCTNYLLPPVSNQTNTCVENCHFGKSFFFLTESFRFVSYSFHSPQVLLEFCGFMQLSAVSFFSEFSHVLRSAVFQLGII